MRALSIIFMLTIAALLTACDNYFVESPIESSAESTSPSQADNPSHEHADHEHADHEHADHEHADHEHADHDHADHEHADHDHEHGDQESKSTDEGKKPDDNNVGIPLPAAANAVAITRKLSATDLFERRILPIMRSEKSSSCRECHFSGVELSNYIHADQATTFAALRDSGLINVEHPDKSKILTFISRTTDDVNPLIAKVRAVELAAFRDWIQAAVADPTLLASKTTDIALGTKLPLQVIQHMRRDHVLRSFVENVWSEIGRCINCHSPDKNQRLIEKHGDRVSWIVPGNPMATLKNLVEAGNIDIESPDDSLVLLKPAGLEDHGGGPKFAPGSRTDKNYRRFLNDYAKSVQGEYKTVESLPAPALQVAIPTGQHLRVIGLPAGLGQKLLKVDIYRWTDAGWSETRWGTAENPINGKKNMWQSIVFFTAPRDSQRAADLMRAKERPLPAGKYLFKLYLDRTGKTREDRDYELGEMELLGEVVTQGPWKPGYQPPKIIHAPE